MTKTSALGSIIIVLILLVASFCFIGCEQESDDHVRNGQITVSPDNIKYSYATAMSNKTVTITAQGGKPDYIWSVAHTNIGTITSHGSTAIYRPADQTGGNFVTATDADGNSATATITQF